MLDLEKVLSLIKAMNAEGVEYITFGAIALWAHGLVRAYDTLQWQMGEIEGVPIRVVTPAQLYEMKRRTVRPKDRGDAEALREEFLLPEE